MHRRGLALLLGFLVAVVVAGGGGVRAPLLPASEPGGPGGPGAPALASSSVIGPMAIAVGRMRME